MNKIYMLALIMLFAMCSAPKHHYYFSHHRPGKAPSPQEAVELPPVYASASHQPSTSIANPLSSVLPGTTSTKTDLSPSRETRRELKKDRHEFRKEFKKTVKDLRASPNESTRAKADTKNGFAVAGLVLSIVGFLLFWPLCILGLIFSVVGLKSERRGLAIAGLVIGIVAMVIILAVGAGIIAAPL